jgi:hypothetical protein
MASSKSSDSVDAAIELATSIISIGLGAQFGPLGQAVGTITTLAGSRISDRFQERRIKRMFDQCVDVVADRTIKFLGNEFRDLESNERAAAILAVRDTFNASELSVKRITKADLNPFELRRILQPASVKVLRSALLNAGGRELYARILNESCDYLVEFVATLPDFGTDALTELLKRETQILRDLKQLLERMPTSRTADDYTADYRRAVVRKLDRMELFGADLDTASRRYPLNVAYVSLQVIRNQYVRPGPERSQLILSSGQPVERAFASLKRVLVIGEAGSGKTTLLRWLAVSSATDSFKESLASWNGCIPFLVSLREFAEAEFPRPADLPRFNARQIADEIPTSWPHDLMRRGKAILLIDGVDELPEGPRRELAREWLHELVETYPNAIYVVTSRSPAIHEPWPDKTFAIAELQPMRMEDIESFVSRWYDAISEEIGDEGTTEGFTQQKRSLYHAIETDRNLRRLAVNPLLCSLICALNRSRQGQLPSDRMGIYRAALEMFLGRRDKERQIAVDPYLTPENQVALMQELAFWLIRQNLATVSIDRAADKIGRIMQSLPRGEHDPAVVTRHLLERSGLLREPVLGQLDFIHRSFQDYLAGKAAIDGDEIELLISGAARDNWRDVILFAVGHAPIAQRERLLRGLIQARNDQKEDTRTRLSILIVGCLLTSAQLGSALREEIEEIAKTLLPPKSIEAAESLASAGDLVLDVISERQPSNASEAIASVRLASMIGGPNALNLIGEIASKHDDIQLEVMRAQRAFDLPQYAHTVLSRARLGTRMEVSDESLLPFLGYLTSVTSLAIDPGDLIDLTRLGNRPPKLVELTVDRRARTSIRGIERWKGLEILTLRVTHMLPDLTSIAELASLRVIRIFVRHGISIRLDLTPLASLPRLAELFFVTDAACNIDLEPLAGRDMKVITSRNVRLSGERRLGPMSQILHTD